MNLATNIIFLTDLTVQPVEKASAVNTKSPGPRLLNSLHHQEEHNNVFQREFKGRKANQSKNHPCFK